MCGSVCKGFNFWVQKSGTKNEKSPVVLNSDSVYHVCSLYACVCVQLICHVGVRHCECVWVWRGHETKLDLNLPHTSADKTGIYT